MNFKRGLFRLWLVVSICWFAVVGVLMWDDLKKDTLWDQSLRFASEDMLMLPVNCKAARGEVGKDYTVAQPGEPWNQYRTNREACWYVQPAFRRLWPEYNDRSASEMYDTLYERLGWEQDVRQKSFHYIAPAALLAFIPSLALLLVGIVAGWIISGFRAQPH